jgi:CheY-like chemotaxis protein
MGHNSAPILPSAITAMPTTSTTQPLVMIVDDNQDGAYVLGSMIEIWGYRCIVANDPRTAIALAQADQVSTFVLDIGLPGMDGYTLGARLKTAYPTAAFIGNSAWRRDNNREQEEGFSFDYFVSKPVGFRELEKLLPLAMKRSQR